MFLAPPAKNRSRVVTIKPSQMHTYIEHTNHSTIWIYPFTHTNRISIHVWYTYLSIRMFSRRRRRPQIIVRWNMLQILFVRYLLLFRFRPQILLKSEIPATAECSIKWKRPKREREMKLCASARICQFIHCAACYFGDNIFILFCDRNSGISFAIPIYIYYIYDLWWSDVRFSSVCLPT